MDGLKVALSLFVFAVLHVAACQAQSPKQIEQLERLLQRFPQADTNRDGTLTREEARQFAAQRRDQRGTREEAQNALPPDHADIAYGPHERHRIDLWLAESDQPTPLLVCIHGGGFRGGDKRSWRRNTQLIQRMLKAGISVAAINYRLTDGGRHPFPIPMHDGARAIQFLRHHAGKYNLDKQKVAATGGSAGGCMSMWLGFHDDLADKDNPDPIARESTRLVAVAPNNGQSCLHMPTLQKWFEVDSLTEHPALRPFFGLPAEGPLELTADYEALAHEASAIEYVTPDDPPCYMTFGANVPIDGDSAPGLWVHHPMMGFRLKQRMQEAGVPCYVQVKGERAVNEFSDQTTFLIQKLTQ